MTKAERAFNKYNLENYDIHQIILDTRLMTVDRLKRIRKQMFLAGFKSNKNKLKVK